MGLLASLALSLFVVLLALFFLSPFFLSPGIHFIESFGRGAFLSILIAFTVILTTSSLLFLSRYFIDRPILELDRAMRESFNQNFLVRAPVLSGDVIGRLAESFNRLLERITTLDAFKIESERELLLAQKEIKYQWELSVRDELTQLYNRRHFQTILPLEIKRCERFSKQLSLLMIDLDFFKNFNDRFGHPAGDACLKEFSKLVNSRIRQIDFFARFGGEEFVIVLPGTPKADARMAAEKIRALVKDHRFVVPGSKDKVSLTVSIGVASYPENGTTMESLVKSADAAMYEAKGTGRDRVVTKRPLPFGDLPTLPASSADFSKDKRDETSA